MRLNRFLTAGGGAAMLALCAGVPAAAATAPSAPVIHEQFTLLPCNGHPSTTVQLEGCAEHKVVTLDKGIDSLNAKVFTKLGKSARAGFVNANSDWVSYRNASCTAQASIYNGGSIQPVAYANCLISIDTSHVAELRAMLAALAPAG